jgi:hypothetical protein
MIQKTGRRLARALLVLSVAWAGCGDVILASDFDQSCVADDDCVTVVVGEMCDCVCTMAAINKSDLAEYEKVATDRPCNTLCAPCEANATAVCDAGRCAVR